MTEQLTLQKGVPVEFTITAAEGDITGCNQTVVFPSFDVKKTLQAGDNVIQFTPDETGIISYTCWMGMLDGRILVVDDLASSPSDAALPEATTSPALIPATPGLGSSRSSGGCCG